MGEIDMECSICCHEFNEIDRIPKFLNCHHTFCGQCVQSLGRIDGNTVNISCPHCRQLMRCYSTTAPFSNLLTTNRYIIEHQKSKRKAAEKLTNREKRLRETEVQLGKMHEKMGESEKVISILRLDCNKMRSENRTLKLTVELCSKWCSTCAKMAIPSCGKLAHLLVDIDEKRKTFPATSFLEGLMARTNANWNCILDERKTIGESLKKIEDHLKNFVTQQLHEYMKSNEERAKCIAGLKAETLPVLSTQTICQYEEKYRSYLQESGKELDALRNISEQVKSIDNLKAHADRYQQELQQAREKKQEFGEGSPSLFKLLLELVAPVVSLSKNESDSAQQSIQMIDLVQAIEDKPTSAPKRKRKKN